MADTSDPVELTDLELISRYSLAVRTARAGRAELIALLRSDLAFLEQGRRPVAVTRRSAASRPVPAVRPRPTRG
jgi:hypothetical protein